MGSDFNEYKTSFQSEENVLELDNGDVQPYCNIVQYNTAPPCEYTKNHS